MVLLFLYHKCCIWRVNLLLVMCLVVGHPFLLLAGVGKDVAVVGLE